MEEEATFKSIEEVIEEYQLPKRCPQINWGPDFEDRPLQDKVSFLKKFADSFNHALDLMQQERNALIAKCDTQEKQLVQNRSVVDQQRNLLQQATTQNNDTKQAYQTKINKLEAKLKELL
jgi:predicted  nucleic acid-binding Zn-ribbon protein